MDDLFKSDKFLAFKNKLANRGKTSLSHVSSSNISRNNRSTLTGARGRALPTSYVSSSKSGRETNQPSSSLDRSVSQFARNEPREISIYQAKVPVNQVSVSQDINLEGNNPLESSVASTSRRNINNGNYQPEDYSLPVRMEDTSGFRRIDNRLQEPQRDRSGFLIPCRPKPLKPVIEPTLPEGALESLHREIYELSQIISPLEIEYRLFKVIKYFKRLKEQEMSKWNSSKYATLNPNENGRESRVNDWLASSYDNLTMIGNETSRYNPRRNNNLPPIYEERGALNCNESVTTQSPFCPIYKLSDWTVLKSSNGCDLCLNGTLYNMQNSLIEKNFTSSKIVMRLEDDVVRTCLADFYLQGKFRDHGIPKEIKVHFKRNKFPENWKSLTKLWTSIEEQEDDVENVSVQGTNAKKDKSQYKQVNKKKKHNGYGLVDYVRSDSEKSEEEDMSEDERPVRRGPLRRSKRKTPDSRSKRDRQDYD